MGARRLAVSFVLEGVRKGDVVVLHSFNCIEYPMVVLGKLNQQSNTESRSRWVEQCSHIYNGNDGRDRNT